MRYRAVAVCAALCALLLVTWVVTLARSGDPSPSQAGPAAPSDWPSSSGVLPGGVRSPWASVPATSPLTATGIELVSAPGVRSMVVDGSGGVWLRSPWQLTRVDPTTGAARTWDVADDAVFATLRSIVPSPAGGVWLVESDRVRLFDGRSFVRDLRVPARSRGGEGRGITSLVEVGSEVWVSSVAGVARSAGGAWTMVGDDTIDGAAMLTLDTEGTLWSVGQVLLPDGELQQTVMRLDGQRWTAMDGPGSPPSVQELMADPTGGVLVRSGFDVRRCAGMSWHSLARIPADRRPGDPAAVGMAVAADGAVWVVGPEILVRGGDSGTSQSIVPVDSPPLVAVGLVGADVMVADSAGLQRLVGDHLDRVWAAPDRGLGAPVDGLLVVSSDEVWATGDGGVHQFEDGRWRQRLSGLGWQGGLPAEWGSDAGLALAADGAVWAITDGAVARFTGDEPAVIPRDRVDGWLLAGPDAGVWAVEAIWPGWSRWYAGEDPDGSTVSLVLADGPRLSVPLPGPPWSLTSLTAGVDGSIWATICEGQRADYCTEPTLMRWDGSWSAVPHPGANVSGITVTPDGAYWAQLTDGDSVSESPTVARYADGTWTRFPEAGHVEWLGAAPGGRVCGVAPRGPELVCVRSTGEVSRAPLAVPAKVLVGPDGSLWVEDSGVVARLPGTVPG
jgi:hypothetical protein